MSMNSHKDVLEMVLPSMAPVLRRPVDTSRSLTHMALMSLLRPELLAYFWRKTSIQAAWYTSPSAPPGGHSARHSTRQHSCRHAGAARSEHKKLSCCWGNRGG
jgi:hypothetical protein